MGGFVGYVDNYTTLTLNDCVFSGALSIPNRYYAAGMVGCCGYRGYTLNISNCLFKGNPGSSGYFHPIVMKGLYGVVTVNASNCYYSVAPTLESSSSYYVAAGTQVYTTVPEGMVYRTVTAADGADYYGPVAVSGVADTYSCSFPLYRRCQYQVSAYRRPHLHRCLPCQWNGRLCLPRKQHQELPFQCGHHVEL